MAKWVPSFLYCEQVGSLQRQFHFTTKDKRQTPGLPLIAAFALFSFFSAHELSFFCRPFSTCDSRGITSRYKARLGKVGGACPYVRGGY